MPLPAGLLAKLKNRGIVAKTPEDDRPKGTPQIHRVGIHQPQPGEEVEEVFAEDYDNDDVTDVPVTKPKPKPVTEEAQPGLMRKVADCPNTSNPYHECSEFCKKRWGCKRFKPDPVMLKRRMRMLRLYPLPQDWYEVADPDTNRYFYWNPVTDELAWLSPSHPRALVVLSADKVKELRADRAEKRPKSPTSDDVKELRADRAEKRPKSPTSDDERQKEQDAESKLAKIREKRHVGKKARFSKREPAEEELDPMDPASYGECPRGNWSSGLDVRGTAKTGVDASASGPLFQQRPYPSPGAVLRANKQIDDS